MTDVAVDTLRLRGPAAARLGRVAATALPAALEHALSDVGDVAIDRIVVSLEVDVEEYDDETLAVLWADVIRAEVLALRGRPARPHRPGSAPGARPAAPLRSTAGIWAAARTWLAARPDTLVLPQALLSLGNPTIARAAAALAGPVEWARLVMALDRLLDPAPAGTGMGGGTEPGPEEPGPSGPERPDLPPPVSPGLTAPPPGPRSVPGATVPSPAEVRVTEKLGVLAELADSRPDGVDLTTLTRAAGLVLVYPWLADHCRRAEGLHPGLDPVEVRQAALAAVAGPGDPSLLEDPLVSLLAGRPDPPPAQRPDRVPLAREAEVAESAAGVLRSFAALLPGFETSTAQFVRECWVLRTGLLDTDRDLVRLTATTHPLDVLLPLLPYPLGLVKLPWSTPVSVRFRP